VWNTIGEVETDAHLSTKTCEYLFESAAGHTQDIEAMIQENERERDEAAIKERPAKKFVGWLHSLCFL